MKKIFPQKFQQGDMIRIIAPSQSLSTAPKEIQNISQENFELLGLRVTFGKHVNESNLFESLNIQARIEDLTDAFADKEVKAVIAARGGYNCNQLLDYLDWEIIKNNPKIFCGFSDITILCNAIYAKTGLVTYSGPNYTTFGQKKYLEYTIEYFRKCLMGNKPFEIKPSEVWLDDKWKENQDKRNPIQNEGYLVVNEGKAEGTLLGGNLCSFNLLQGTQYFPNLTDAILFFEEDEQAKEYTAIEFDRNLQSVIQQPQFSSVRGIVLGRFQIASKVTNKMIIEIIKTKKELDNIPVIANVDFGHTDPKITFPIGGRVKIDTDKSLLKIIH